MDGYPTANEPPHEVVEDELYSQAALQLLGDQRTVDEKLKDLIWVIARIPGSFARIPSTPIFRAVYDGDPRLRVWYTFNGFQVTLRYIESYEPNDAEVET